MEENLVRGLMYTDGSFLAFFRSPIAAVFMGISILVVLWTAYKEIRGRFPQKEAA